MPWVFEMSRHGFLKAYTSRAVRYVLESTTREHAYGPKDLADIDKPTLLIWGEQDGLFQLEVARAMERHLPHSQLVTLRHTGHAAHWENPREMTAAIDRFRRRGLEPRLRVG